MENAAKLMYEDDGGAKNNKDDLDAVLYTRRSSRGMKDNLLDELLKGKLEMETVEELFQKMKNEFRETGEGERKIEQLRVIEQRRRTCNEYIQEFKKMARGSGYKGRPLIEEFKRRLSGALRRKLAETETPPSTIEE